MPGTLSRADLVTDLKASLHDAAGVFTAPVDGDLSRILDVATQDFHRVRPRTQVGQITLLTNTTTYVAPADLIDYKADTWSEGKMPAPWESNYPGRLPSVRVAEVAGVRSLVFVPGPTSQQIALFGATFTFFYLAAHAVGAAAADTTIVAGDRGLLLLRAQAEVLRELAVRNMGKPVQLRDGLSGTPRNGMPSHLYEVMMAEFERAKR